MAIFQSQMIKRESARSSLPIETNPEYREKRRQVDFWVARWQSGNNELCGPLALDLNVPDDLDATSEADRTDLLVRGDLRSSIHLRRRAVVEVVAVMTIEPQTIRLKKGRPFERDAVKCGCGGYAGKGDANDEEKRLAGCACCARAFVCVIGGHRYAGSAEAPEYRD